MIITSQFKDLFKTMIDSLLIEGSLSLPCKLIYENSLKNECINCEIDPLSKRSSGIYKSGGPISFIDGQICPYCGGLGFLQASNEETVHLLVLFDYKTWINFKSDVKAPDGMIQTICGIDLLPKIKNANRLIVDTNLNGLTRNIFTRDSDPQPAGLGDNHYIFTFWKKI